MRFKQRGVGGPGLPHGRDVDALNDLAGEVFLRRPDTPEASEAARRAVEAADHLFEHDDGLPNQRRLARALWRRLSTFSIPAERDAVEQVALRCWSVCTGMLSAARGDPLAFDDAVGDVAMWAGVLVPKLGLVGRHAEALQVYETFTAAAEQADGPRGRQARARLMIFPLAAAADSAAEQRINGRWDASAEQSLAGAIESCGGVLQELSRHLNDGSFEVSEVARVLQVLSRLLTVGGLLSEAAIALDDAIGLLETVAGEGPRYAAFLQAVEAERDGLRGRVPDTASAAAPSAPITVPRRAFLRAALDAGIDADALPSTDELAEAAVVRMREAESADPARFGPARGLLMAWRARLLLEAGNPGLAVDLADQSVRQLSLYLDRPRQIQASLVVALAVLRQAASACGHTDRATRAGQRAATVYAALIALDATYGQDLDGAI